MENQAVIETSLNMSKYSPVEIHLKITFIKEGRGQNKKSYVLEFIKHT